MGDESSGSSLAGNPITCCETVGQHNLPPPGGKGKEKDVIRKGVWLGLLLVIVIMVGCATTKTITLKSGEMLRAKTIEETASTYVIEEEKTGRRTVIPKGAVVSIK